MGSLFYVINTFLVVIKSRNLKKRFFSKFFTSHFNCVKCIFFEFLNEGGRKEMRKIVLSVMVVAFSLALASNSFAKKGKYKEGSAGSGSITGTVSLKGTPMAVSYTHLTLPTICSV